MRWSNVLFAAGCLGLIFGCGGDDDGKGSADAALVSLDAVLVDGSISLSDADVTALPDSSITAMPDGSIVGEPDGSIVGGPDGSVAQDAGIVLPNCNPLEQTGCGVGEKCSILSLGDSFQTTCVPNGIVDIGGTCEFGVDGYDDCIKGSLCMGQVCEEICVNDSCAASGQTCSLYTDLFGTGLDDVGVCEASCDVLSQNCAAEEDACYLQLSTGVGVCAYEPEETVDIGQGDTCYGDGNGCYLNGCPAGMLAFVQSADSVSLDVCNYFCSPVNSYAGLAGSDPNGAAPMDCGIANTGKANQQCRFLQGTFSSLDNIPASLGVCVDEAVWGDCGQCELEMLVNLSDADYEEYCGMNPEACNCIGCVDDATIDALVR